MSDKAPTFRIALDWQAIREAWEGSPADPSRDYLRAWIDDPFYPINAVLFPDAKGMTAKMAMSFST